MKLHKIEIFNVRPCKYWRYHNYR